MSERAPGMLVIEADAHPSITANTFYNLRPDAVTVPSPGQFPTLARDNWFIPAADPQPPRREGRGRR
jgi:hypothetical protein